MAGTFDVEGDAVRFLPSYPFLAGTTYVWTFREALPADAPANLRIRRPRAVVAASTSVTAIYPSAVEVPFNLLRFYVHFSAPMSEGMAAKAVELQDTLSGAVLPNAIFAVEPELWDRARRRLTVLLDPGRIKRGLVPNAEAGYAIRPGQLVSLVIDRTFRDAAGVPLRETARRDFVIGAALRRRVDPAGWSYRWPPAGSSRPIIIDFDRPLDHALAQRCLSVRDSSDFPLAGDVVVAAGERQWQFTPDGPWAPGLYTLTMQSQLEDVAGNSMIRVFDRDLDQPQDDPIQAQVIEVEFECVAG